MNNMSNVMSTATTFLSTESMPHKLSLSWKVLLNRVKLTDSIQGQKVSETCSALWQSNEQWFTFIYRMFSALKWRDFHQMHLHVVSNMGFFYQSDFSSLKVRCKHSMLMSWVGVLSSVLCCTCNHTQHWCHGALVYTCTSMPQGEKFNQ